MQKFVRRRAVQLLTLVSGVCLATFTVVPQPWGAWTLLGGVVIGISGLLVENRKADALEAMDATAAALTAERDASRHRADSLSQGVEKTSIQILVALTKLCSGEASTLRASVYEHLPQHWLRIARYSASAAYRDGGRQKIPLGEGLLHRAYERNAAEANGLPDRDRAPVQYERDQCRLQLPDGMSGKLRMPSRSYAVFLFEGDPTDPAARTFALCLESTDPQGVNRKDVAAKLDCWWPALHETFSRLDRAGR